MLLRRLCIALALCVFALVLVRTAWIADDAAITLRTVLNTLHGYGARFNIDERVQAYTHPLWFFALTGFSALGALLQADVFAVSYALSIGVSLLALAVLLLALGRQWPLIALVALAALLSQAFVDYSASGLENPLAHLLALLAWLCALQAAQGPGPKGSASALTVAVPIQARAGFGGTAGFFVCSGLAYLTRPDMLVLLAPLALWLMALGALQRHNPRALLAAMLIGALPVLVWTVFSLFYYGWPWPNTAYAKLGTGIALDERLAQGLRYLAHSARHDPLTLLVIASGLLLGLLRPGRDWPQAPQRALALGMAAYLAYVVWIGGDFMAGRFLSLPFFAALMLLLMQPLPKAAMVAVTAAAAAGVLALGLLVPATPTVFSGADFAQRTLDDSGIANERGHYYAETGLLRGLSPQLRQAAAQWGVVQGEVKGEGLGGLHIICGGMGFTSIYQGPHTHVIDQCALADPLLSRLPAKAVTPWRIGHFYRVLPANYIESVRQRRNLLSDPALQAPYDTIRRLTRDPLWSGARLRTLLAANLRGLDIPATALAAYRRGEVGESDAVHRLPAAVLAARPFDEHALFYLHRFVFFQHALELEWPEPEAIGQIRLLLDPGDDYRVSVLALGQDGQWDWRNLAEISARPDFHFDRHTLELPDAPRVARLRIEGQGGDGIYAVAEVQWEKR